MSSKTPKALGIAGALLVPAIAVAALNIPNSFSAGQLLSSASLNENFEAIESEVNAIDSELSTLNSQVNGLDSEVNGLGTDVTGVTNDVNSLSAQIAALTAELDDLRSEAEEREGVAGYVTKGTTTVPFYRKVLTGTRNETTESIAHGIPGDPAAEGRILSCTVSTLLSGNQNFSIYVGTGASAVYWCYFVGNNVETEWLQSGSMSYQITIDYVESW